VLFSFVYFDTVAFDYAQATVKITVRQRWRSPSGNGEDHRQATVKITVRQRWRPPLGNGEDHR